MAASSKHDKILDALLELLQTRDIQKISVSDIAEKAGMGKGSIYYYFSSKDDIINALVERSYEKPLETAKVLATQTHIPAFTRMAMLFQACRNSSVEFLEQDHNTHASGNTPGSIQEQAYIHQKYLSHIIAELKPALTAIIEQGIEAGDINFAYPMQLAEIVLIVLAVKLDNTLTPSTPAEIEQTLQALVALLEKGTDTPVGALNYLITY